MQYSFFAWPGRILNWLCGGRQDYRSFKQRKRTRAHRANQNICLLIWGAGAVLMLICGNGGCLLAIGLVATFVCFAMLDPS
ncbi:MAG TPA: hypothetical protein DDY14_01855 [Chromatiaceae bacterium]|jgi:hypothetical protein|nr:MAG: hypothetical protein N838_20705 [Thiohalocapsa sp. PB-PSB1]HBG94076.1 hypothetical protein [Chromatiaceae bacterium]HCS92762.1 hypothetical protein [Chromatiaceae bacterium]